MLKITKQQTIAGITVYGDERFDDVFYPMPEAPRFRLDEFGRPIFKFLKYRHPLTREDGRTGGGFAFFDTEFTLSKRKREKVLDVLNEQVQAMERSPDFKRSAPGPARARLGSVTYTRGTAKLLLSEEGGTLIEAVKSPGKPSLFGRNICSFMVEFSPEGATLFEQALQGRGGVVQVAYDLHLMVKLPDMSARAWFEADKFYSYVQETTVDFKLYGDDTYVDKITEEFMDNETMGIELHLDAVLPDPDADRKLKDKIRSMMDRALQDALLRKMIPDIESVPLDDRGIPKRIDKLERSLTVNRVASFEYEYRESSAIEWNLAPQGTIPNITNLKDNEGRPIKWDDYATLVDLDDPFFKQLNVQVGVNADFDNLPIHSVEVKLEYHEGNEHELAEFSFTDPDKKETFRTFIENDKREYTYSFQVNFVGSSNVFTSKPKVIDDNVLTVNVDDMGLLVVDVEAGDIDFTQVRSAQVTVAYQDVGVERFEESFVLSESDPKHEIKHVLFQPRRRPIQYRTDYFMKDGRQISSPFQSTSSSPIIVNDPLGRTKRFEVRAVGDFVNRIEQIFLDLVYTDQANDYSVEQSFVMAAGNESVSQPYAVLGEGDGVVSYSGQIRYRDGTVKVIEPAVADGTIMVGDVVSAKLTVSAIPDLIDWTQFRLVRLELRHGAEVGGSANDMIFSPQAPGPQSWEVLLDEDQDAVYRWRATYFDAASQQHVTDWATATSPSIVLQPPVVAAPPSPVPAPAPVAPPVPTDPINPIPAPAPVAAAIPTPAPPAPAPAPVSGGSVPPPPPIPGGSVPPPPPIPGGSVPPPPPNPSA